MKKKFFYFMKSYFSFTKREAKGFVLVMPCLIVLYFIPILYQRSVNHFSQQDYEAYQREADAFFANLDRVPEPLNLPSEVIFNPNAVSEDHLINLGLDPKTAQNWVKYIQAGGIFLQPSDLQKIYGMNDSVLLALKDNLVFDTVPSKADHRTGYRKPAAPAMAKIPFTEADSITLQIVPGIGQVLAGRIVKFRENLGGLHNPNQLMDVYGVEEELVGRIFEHFIFESKISQKLDINHLTIQQLAQHPYITYAQAKVIVAFREQHGKYQQAEDLLKIKIFTQEWLDRLAPYLDI